MTSSFIGYHASAGYLEGGSLGYECNHQRNLKTMRGAKSNELFSEGTN